jgi:hypothetical protein
VYYELPIFKAVEDCPEITVENIQGSFDYSGTIRIYCTGNPGYYRRSGTVDVYFYVDKEEKLPAREHKTINWVQEGPSPDIYWLENTAQVPAYNTDLGREKENVVIYPFFQYRAVEEIIISADDEVRATINSGVTPSYVELSFPPNKTLSEKTWNVRIIGTAFNEGVEDVYDDLTVTQEKGVAPDFYFRDGTYKYTKTVSGTSQFSEYIAYNGIYMNFEQVTYEFINQGNLHSVDINVESDKQYYKYAFVILNGNTTGSEIRSSFRIIAKDVYGDDRIIEVEYIQPGI